MDFFHFTYSFQPHYGPGIDTASNRNEHQESSWGLKGGRRITGLYYLSIVLEKLGKT
jgi:hypothetical protein